MSVQNSALIGIDARQIGIASHMLRNCLASNRASHHGTMRYRDGIWCIGLFVSFLVVVVVVVVLFL